MSDQLQQIDPKLIKQMRMLTAGQRDLSKPQVLVFDDDWNDISHTDTQETISYNELDKIYGDETFEKCNCKNTKTYYLFDDDRRIAIVCLDHNKYYTIWD